VRVISTERLAALVSAAIHTGAEHPGRAVYSMIECWQHSLTVVHDDFSCGLDINKRLASQDRMSGS
jgi:hypothetical protein